MPWPSDYPLRQGHIFRGSTHPAGRVRGRRSRPRGSGPDSHQRPAVSARPGYLSSEKTRNGSAQKTTVALTRQGRKALDAYTQALRDLIGGL